MAFSFFRRRQKLVIIIMVALMISFLVGVQGLKGLLKSGQGGSGETAIGDSKYGELTAIQRAYAYQDIEHLQMLGLTNPLQGGSLDFVYMVAVNGPEASTAFALLGTEAAAMGYKITPGEIDQWFADRGLVGEKFDAFVTQLRERSREITAGFLKEIVGRWLLVNKAYKASMVSVPPTEAETKQLYRDLNEKIDLEIAAISALDMLDEVAQPSDEQIVEQFNKYRTEIPGSYSDSNSFGFGYVQPHRANVQYLLINQAAITQVSQVGSDAIQNYYMDHRSQFVKTVEQPEAEVTDAETQPAPAAPKQVQMTFSEARDQIFQLLQEEMMANRMADLASRARSILDSLDEATLAGANPYDLVVGKLLSPADDLLASRTGSLDIQAQRLDGAIKMISDAAGVQIAYPVGNVDQYTIDPAIEITITVADASLGEALAAVTRQLPGVESLTWVKCAGMVDAIFSAGPAKTLPVIADQTGLSDFRKLQANQVLAYSMSGPGQFLLEQVSKARPFGGTSGMEAGSEGAKMRVFSVNGSAGGELHWRLAQAEASHALEQITSADELAGEIRSQVSDDIKTEAAYAIALDKAGALEVEAAKTDLKTAAEALGVSTSETGLFARKTRRLPQQEIYQQLQMTGRLTPETMVLAMLESPFRFESNRVPGVALPSEESREAFLNQAFGLAPENVEPPYTDGKPMATIGVKSRAEVLVAQRIGFAPAVGSEYETAADDTPSGKEDLMAALVAVGNWQARVSWFDYKKIAERTGFKARPFLTEKAEDEGASDGLKPAEAADEAPAQTQQAQ